MPLCSPLHWSASEDHLLPRSERGVRIRSRTAPPGFVEVFGQTTSDDGEGEVEGASLEAEWMSCSTDFVESFNPETTRRWSGLLILLGLVPITFVEPLSNPVCDRYFF